MISETLRKVLEALEQVTAEGDGWVGCCPAHDDSRPSLRISEGEDGRILLVCRSAGCSALQIVSALGLSVGDLFPETVYSYLDEQGELLFQEVRKHGRAKAFFRRPNGFGGWVHDLGDVPRVLFGLPQLLAASPNDLIWVAEGPKDCMTLRGWGLTAVCNPGGAGGQWLDQYTDCLAGRHVRVLKDYDAAGERHRTKILEALNGVAATLKAVELPGAGPGDDVTRWALRGGSKALLLAAEQLSFLNLLLSQGVLADSAPFPVEVLPPAIARYVLEAAATLDCSPDLVAVPLLGFTGAALGRRAVIRIKPGFEERAATWNAVVARPGATKTPAQNMARAGIDVRQRQAVRAYKEALEGWREEHLLWEQTPKRERGYEPERPRLRSYYTTDYTWEALCVLADQADGVAITQDELLNWIRSCDVYHGGKGPDRSRWLSAWSGTPIFVHRRSNPDPLLIETHALPIVGGIQPELLPELGDEAGRRDGLVERLLYSYPETWTSRWSDSEISDATRQGYLEVFDQLYAAEYRDGQCILLSPAARERFQDWMNENAAQVDEVSGVLAGMYAKLPVQLARVTLQLHGLWHPKSPAAELVSLDLLERAILLIEYFRSHARRVVPSFGVRVPPGEARREDPVTLFRNRVARVLQEAQGEWVARETLFRRLGHPPTAEQLSTALTALEAEGKVETRRARTAGRPREESRWLFEEEIPKTDGERSKFRKESPPAPAAQVAPDAPLSDLPAYTYVTTDAGLDAILPELLTLPTLHLDTETAVQAGETWKRAAKDSSALDPQRARLRLLQIQGQETTYLIDCFSCDVTRLAPLFARKIELVAHNAKFDLQILAAAGLDLSLVQPHCTLLAGKLVTAQMGQSASLKALAKRFLDQPMDKAEQASDWSIPMLTPEQLSYAAADVQVLPTLRATLDREILQRDLEQVHAVEQALIPCMVAMEQAGMPIHVGVWLREADFQEAERKRLAERVPQALGVPAFSITKRAALGDALLAAGVQLPLTPKGKPATNKKVLRRLRDEHPILNDVLAWSKADTLSRTFGRPFVAKAKEGRLHASFSQLGTVTGRMSCSGPNLQQVPKSLEARSCFAVGQGALIVADLSQIQVACAAFVSGDQKLILALNQGTDVHRQTAAALLQKPEAQITAEDRAFGKTAVFGILFGEGAAGLVESALDWGWLLSTADAQAMLKRFDSAWPTLAKWRKRQMARQDPQIRCGAGLRRVRYLGPKERGTVRANTPIQQLEADVVKYALLQLWRSRQEHPTARLVSVIHDEVIVEEQDPDHCYPVEAWVKEGLLEGCRQFLPGIDVQVETRIGSSWAKEDAWPTEEQLRMGQEAAARRTRRG